MCLFAETFTRGTTHAHVSLRILTTLISRSRKVDSSVDCESSLPSTREWTCRNYPFYVWQSGIGLYVGTLSWGNATGTTRLRDSIVAELQIGGIMGIVCCWISIQPASGRQRRTSHFRSGDGTLPLFLPSLPLLSTYWIHLQRREFWKVHESGPNLPRVVTSETLSYRIAISNNANRSRISESVPR